MNDKKNLIISISLAVNVFLIAFMLGRLTTAHESHHFAMPPGPMGMMPPPPMGFHGMGGMRGWMPGGEPHHPPFIGLSSIFSPAELEADWPFAEEHFNKVEAMRREFAKQLDKDGAVTPDMVMKHLNEVDQVMGEVKTHINQKIAAKISAMSPEERKRFAETLLEDRE